MKTPLSKPNRGEGDHFQETQSEQCLWFSWFNVLFHCFIMCLCCPKPYVMYFLLL